MKKTNKRQAKTRVVFRAFSDGEIIALFPDESTHGGFIGSYMHEGQHGDASRGLVNNTKPASAEQYAPLFAELHKIGYCLEVVQKLTRRTAPRTYEAQKERARQMAIDWQTECGERSMSYGEIAEAGEHFEKLGKRYGLLREFRENAIPC